VCPNWWCECRDNWREGYDELLLVENGRTKHARVDQKIYSLRFFLFVAG
jgi:hypothetical protein